MSVSRQVKKVLYSSIDRIDSRRDDFVMRKGRDFTRKGKISFQDVIKPNILSHSGTMDDELRTYYPNIDERPTASAYVQRRDTVSYEAVKSLFYDVTERLSKKLKPNNTFYGYRVLAIDGSNVKTAFENGRIPHECEHPSLIHLHCIYDVLNRYYIAAHAGDCYGKGTGEVSVARWLVKYIKETKEPTVIVADRGYTSLCLMRHIEEQGMDYCIRVRKRWLSIINNLPEIELDRDIEINISTSQSKEARAGYAAKTLFHLHSEDWDFEKFYTMKFRLVQFKLDNGTYETLVTSLPRSLFPLKALKKLYFLRWNEETSFRWLKHVSGLDYIHCWKYEAMLMEIWSHMIAFNLSMFIITALNIRQMKKKHEHQINVTMGIKICLDYFCNDKAPPCDKEILKYTVPIREGRTRDRKIIYTAFRGFNYRAA